jgi:hypothetical protein
MPVTGPRDIAGRRFVAGGSPDAGRPDAGENLATVL